VQDICRQELPHLRALNRAWVACVRAEAINSTSLPDASAKSP
jgi:hypothetical protein